MISKLFYKRNSNISKQSKVYPFTKVINSSIGSFSYVSYFCSINNVNIGKYCSIAKRTSIGLGFHPTDFISSSQYSILIIIHLKNLLLIKKHLMI